MTDKEQRLHTLAHEYLNYIQLMAMPDIQPEDHSHLSAQRTIVHDELIALTGLARPFDMATYCADLLSGRAQPVVI